METRLIIFVACIATFSSLSCLQAMQRTSDGFDERYYQPLSRREELPLLAVASGSIEKVDYFVQGNAVLKDALLYAVRCADTSNHESIVILQHLLGKCKKKKLLTKDFEAVLNRAILDNPILRDIL